MAVALRDLEQARAPRRPGLRIVSPQPTPPRRRPTRTVYWLRRAAVLAVAVALAVGLVATTRALRADTTTPVPRIDMTVVIPAGGTLWDLADRYAPADMDRSAWVLAVAERNDLDPGAILPGTPVSVPVAADRVVAQPQARSAR
jgi:hypothetical protein